MVDFQELAFFTFSRYSVDGETGERYSECDKTMVGWYRPVGPGEMETWGCFYAEKEVEIDPVLWENPVETTSFLETMEKKYEDYGELIEEINDRKSTWLAAVNDNFVGLTLYDVYSRLNARRSSKPTVSAESDLGVLEGLSSEELLKLRQFDPISLTAFLTTPLDMIPVSSLPASWDWSDISSTSYIPSDIINQGSCGSCYVISTMEMLESRLKIYTNGEFDKRLSAQFPLSCSFYTEGCKGGYGVLVSRFISEFGVPLDECVPYQGSDQHCDLTCGKEKLWVGVESYGYLGGYYGACTAEMMQKELRAHGPFTVSLNPSPDFLFYKEGIYQSQAMRPNATVSMLDMGVDWEQVEHSVLLVGWGEDQGVKYWKVLNSWGEDWGEHGFFRIIRGVDDSSIESNGQFAVPYFL